MANVIVPLFFVVFAINYNPAFANNGVQPAVNAATNPGQAEQVPLNEDQLAAMTGVQLEEAFTLVMNSLLKVYYALPLHEKFKVQSTFTLLKLYSEDPLTTAFLDKMLPQIKVKLRPSSNTPPQPSIMPESYMKALFNSSPFVNGLKDMHANTLHSAADAISNTKEFLSGAAGDMSRRAKLVAAPFKGLLPTIPLRLEFKPPTVSSPFGIEDHLRNEGDKKKLEVAENRLQATSVTQNL